MNKYRCICSFSFNNRKFIGGEVITEFVYFQLPLKYQSQFVKLPQNELLYHDIGENNA